MSLLNKDLHIIEAVLISHQSLRSCCHSACARRAPFVAYATFPPFCGGIARQGKPLCGYAWMFRLRYAPLNMTIKKSR